MLPTDYKESTILGAQPLPLSSPEKVWHWLRRRGAQERGRDSQRTSFKCGAGPLLDPLSGSKQSGCAASLLYPSTWGWGAPGQARGFHMQDWNLCLRKTSLKSWPQAIGINRSWAAPYNDFLLQCCYHPVTRAFFVTPWGPLFLAQLLSVSSNEILNSSQRSYSLLMCSYSAWHNRCLISVGTFTCCCDNNFMSSLSLRSIAAYETAAVSLYKAVDWFNSLCSRNKGLIFPVEMDMSKRGWSMNKKAILLSKGKI